MTSSSKRILFLSFYDLRLKEKNKRKSKPKQNQNKTETWKANNLKKKVKKIPRYLTTKNFLMSFNYAKREYIIRQKKKRIILYKKFLWPEWGQRGKHLPFKQKTCVQFMRYVTQYEYNTYVFMYPTRSDPWAQSMRTSHDPSECSPQIKETNLYFTFRGVLPPTNIQYIILWRIYKINN